MTLETVTRMNISSRDQQDLEEHPGREMIGIMSTFE